MSHLAHRWTLTMVCLCWFMGCQGPAPTPDVQRGVVLDVRMAPGSGLDPDGVSWHPAEAVSNVVRHADGSTQLLVDPDASSLELGHPEACPTHVDLSTIDSDHTIVTLRPWI